MGWHGTALMKKKTKDIVLLQYSDSRFKDTRWVSQESGGQKQSVFYSKMLDFGG